LLLKSFQEKFLLVGVPVAVGVGVGVGVGVAVVAPGFD
jgi:hypothetical protein